VKTLNVLIIDCYKQVYKIVYTKNHTDDNCDKCDKKVGKENLIPVPFIYLDRNDKIHPDEREKIVQEKYEKMLEVSNDQFLSKLYADKQKENMSKGYRQYWVCEDCYKIVANSRKVKK